MMRSRHEGHRLIRTPELASICYSSYDDAAGCGPLRPTAPRPCGASLVRDAPDLILPWADDDPAGGRGLTWEGYAGTWRAKGAAFRNRSHGPKL